MMPAMERGRRTGRSRRTGHEEADRCRVARRGRADRGRPGRVPGSRHAERDRRWRRAGALPGAARRARPDPRGRRDGHDAVRQRPAVRRSARDVEPRPSGDRPADPARLHRGRFADRPDQHVRRQPAPAPAARPAGSRRRAQPHGRDPPPQRGAGGRRSGAGRGRHRTQRRDRRPARHARLRRGGRRVPRAGGVARRGRGRPDLDRDDVRPERDQGGDRGRPAGGSRHRPGRDDDLRHARLHDDGRHARGRGGAPRGLGARTPSAATAGTAPTSSSR